MDSTATIISHEEQKAQPYSMRVIEYEILPSKLKTRQPACLLRCAGCISVKISGQI